LSCLRHISGTECPHVWRNLVHKNELIATYERERNILTIVSIFTNLEKIAI